MIKFVFVVVLFLVFVEWGFAKVHQKVTIQTTSNSQTHPDKTILTPAHKATGTTTKRPPTNHIIEEKKIETSKRLPPPTSVKSNPPPIILSGEEQKIKNKLARDAVMDGEIHKAKQFLPPNHKAETLVTIKSPELKVKEADHIRIEKLSSAIENMIAENAVPNANFSLMNEVYHPGNMCPFQNKVMAKLLAKEPINIVIIGGSVTWGSELNNRMVDRWSTPFTNIVTAHNWIVGGNKIKVYNRAVQALGLNLWLQKMNELRDADLLIVDTSVNDQGILGKIPDYYDLLFQLVDSLAPKTKDQLPPALLLLYAFRTSNFDKQDVNAHCPGNYSTCCNGYVYCRQWWDMHDQAVPILNHYNIPYISFRDMMWPKFDSPPENLPQIWNGRSHPGKETHLLFAKSFAHGFMRQIKDLLENPSIAQHCRENEKFNTYVRAETMIGHNGNHIGGGTSSGGSNSGNSGSVQKAQALCSDFLDYMVADTTPESKNNFIMSPAEKAPFHYDYNTSISSDNNTDSIAHAATTVLKHPHWRYYNDSQSKYGWILIADKAQVAEMCSGQPWCAEAQQEYAVSFQIRVGGTEPLLRIMFLKSRSVEMGTATLWLDNDATHSVDLRSHWTENYSLSHSIVITPTLDALSGVNVLMKGEHYALQSLSPGVHTLHISISNNTGNWVLRDRFKFKLLGISTC